MTASPVIPAPLAATCRKTPEWSAWLERLPRVIRELEARWSLALGAPFEDEVSCSWVAPVERRNGARAVLKIGIPHMESADEARGLRFWAGDPTVRLLDADESLHALLIERCEPGTKLRLLPEPEQDTVIAGLLRRLWREPAPREFRPLSELTSHWAAGARARPPGRLDPGLVREGLHVFEELPRTAPRTVSLATDLHAGNVLRAEREPWLVIDPKPFAGDPAYDATQHLFNCDERMHAQPEATIHRFADLLGVSRERVRLWMFARIAAESRDSWADVAAALVRG